MYSEKELYVEACDIIEASIDRGQPVVKAWAVNAIISEHPEIEGMDKDFYLLCAHKHVEDVVRKSLGRYKADSPDVQPEQKLLFPGFKRLLRAYLVTRDDEQVAIPTDQLTDDEILLKIKEQEGMAKGCIEHARELRRYMEQRREKRTA